jgi:hypothetical protein
VHVDLAVQGLCDQFRRAAIAPSHQSDACFIAGRFKSEHEHLQGPLEVISVIAQGWCEFVLKFEENHPHAAARSGGQGRHKKGAGNMKEYRLTAWPDLPPEFRKTAYRRMVSELSQRHVVIKHLERCGGLSTSDVQGFLNFLEGRGVLETREGETTKPKVGWVRAFFQT